MTYPEKLKDPRWQRKRLEILNRDKFLCLECGRGDIPLHVHHEYYISGRLPWEYPNFCYRTLCEDCHEIVKERVKPGGESTHLADWEILADICGPDGLAQELACEIHWFGEETGRSHTETIQYIIDWFKSKS